MCVPPPENAVSVAIKGVMPNATVESVHALQSARLQRLYEVKLTDGSSLHLSLPPPYMVKLLRSERSTLSSEAALLRWIAESSRSGRFQAPAGDTAGSIARGAGQEDGRNHKSDAKILQPTAFFPLLVSQSSGGTDIGVDHNILKPLAGVPISTLSPPLSKAERRSVDFQIGILLRRISKLKSPFEMFGPALAALDAPLKPPRRIGSTRIIETRGVASWYTAFAALMEGILRDGEDMAVMLPYSTIRKHVLRFEHVLNRVTKPCLVAVDTGLDCNTLVVREKQNPGSKHVGSSSSKTPGHQKNSSSKESSKKTDTKKGKEPIGDDADIVSALTYADAGIEVTGLRDWSNCIFGDPLFSTIFSQEPSAELLLGFDRPLDDQEQRSAEGEATWCGFGFTTSPIEDKANTRTRLLLYECYHALVRIVREFYRPQKDSSKRELAARKQLNSLLTRLDEVGWGPEGGAGQRRRRGSGELSPAKRPKGNAEVDEDTQDIGSYNGIW